MPTALSVEKNKSGRGCAIIFGLVFMSAGCAMCFFMIVRPLYLVSTSGDWVETPCTIVSSQVKRHSDSDGTTYSIDITYQYEIRQQNFTNDRYDFMGQFSSSGRQSKQDVVDQYPKGSKQVCFVDPDAPDSAVLSRDRPGSIWWGLMSVPFILFGGLIALFAGRKAPRRNLSEDSAISVSGMSRKSRTAMRLFEGEKVRGNEPVELKPTTGPMGKFLGALFVAMFWNGIVSVFVGVLFNEFQWFLSLIHI